MRLRRPALPDEELKVRPLPPDDEAPRPARAGPARVALIGVGAVIGSLLVWSQMTGSTPAEEEPVAADVPGPLGGSVTVNTAPVAWYETEYEVDTGLGTVTWRQVALTSDAPSSYASTLDWRGSAYSVLLAVEGDLVRFTSPDGLRWSEEPASEDDLARSAATTTAQLAAIDAELANRNTLPISEVSAAAHGGRVLAVGSATEDPDDRRQRTAAWISDAGEEWRLLPHLAGGPTAARFVAAGDAGWALAWHQCDPGCGEEIWLSADGTDWNRLKMANSAREGAFVAAAGIAVGPISIVFAGMRYETAPYDGTHTAVLWVGSIDQ